MHPATGRVGTPEVFLASETQRADSVLSLSSFPPSIHQISSFRRRYKLLHSLPPLDPLRIRIGILCLFSSRSWRSGTRAQRGCRGFARSEGRESRKQAQEGSQMGQEREGGRLGHGSRGEGGESTSLLASRRRMDWREKGGKEGNSGRLSDRARTSASPPISFSVLTSAAHSLSSFPRPSSQVEDRLRARLRLTLSHHLPASLRPASSPRSPSPPLLPHLRSPSPPPPLSSSSLSYLLSPPRSFTEIVCSPAMRHTFASGHLEDALGRTAGELIEGETGLLKALGRFFEECRERGVGREEHVRGRGGEGSEDEEEHPPPAVVVVHEVAKEKVEEEQQPMVVEAEVETIVEAGGSTPMDTDLPPLPIPTTNGVDHPLDAPSTTIPNGTAEASTSAPPPPPPPPPLPTTTVETLPNTVLDPTLQEQQLPPPPPPSQPTSVASPPIVPAPPPLPLSPNAASASSLSALEKMFITPEGISALGPVEEIRVRLGLMPPPPVAVLNIEMQKEALYRGMDALVSFEQDPFL